jgi:hypothetical protein
MTRDKRLDELRQEWKTKNGKVRTSPEVSKKIAEDPAGRVIIPHPGDRVGDLVNSYNRLACNHRPAPLTNSVQDSLE